MHREGGESFAPVRSAIDLYYRARFGDRGLTDTEVSWVEELIQSLEIVPIRAPAAPGVS